MAKTQPTASVVSFYSGIAEAWGDQYDTSRLLTLKEYPANHFRLRIILKRLQETGAKRLIDFGLGEGSPARAFHELGLDVRGFDFTPEMVEQARRNFHTWGMNPAHVIQGDVCDPESYTELLRDGTFDAAVCLGVMPHVEDDAKVLANLRASLSSGGKVFVSFRNDLFSLATMNRYTHAFYMDTLLAAAPEALREAVAEDISQRLRMDMPPVREKTEAGGVGYDTILAKFHNPLAITPLFTQAGFTDVTVRFYHFHPGPPYLEQKVGTRAFRAAAMALEENPEDWRGHFLCSAFLVEAMAA